MNSDTHHNNICRYINDIYIYYGRNNHDIIIYNIVFTLF